MSEDQNVPHNSVFSRRSKENPPVINELCNSLGLNVLDLIQLTEEQLDHLIILKDAQGSLSPKSKPKSNDIFKLKSYDGIVKPKSYEDTVPIKSNGDTIVFSKSTINLDFTESNNSIIFPFDYNTIKKKELIFKSNIPIKRRSRKSIARVTVVSKNGKSKNVPQKYLTTDKRKSSKSTGSSRTFVSKTCIASKKCINCDDKILSSISIAKKKARPKKKLNKISKIIKRTTKLISKRNLKTEDSRTITSTDSKRELTKVDFELSNEINVENSTDLTVDKKKK